VHLKASEDHFILVHKPFQGIYRFILRYVYHYDFDYLSVMTYAAQELYMYCVLFENKKRKNDGRINAKIINKHNSSA